jgi:rod shape-determining protein MreB
MPTLDIGIDLGTTTILASDRKRKVIVREPCVIALRRKSGEVLKIGSEVLKMVGRNPATIEIVRPLSQGVISNYRMTEVLIRYLLRRINYNDLLKPRVSVCVPSGITRVESNAVVDAALSAGARKVYLIEEPVAAAIGAGVDLSLPRGRLIVDIGGGTSDMAVLSFNGIVCKSSIRVAGNDFDEAVAKYIRAKYSLLVGEKTAEEIKMAIGSVDPEEEDDPEMQAKGRDLVSGLPKQVTVRRSELLAPLMEVAESILRTVQQVLEKTPPELAADIREDGMILTGGGSLIHGFDKLLSRETRVTATAAENAVECVAQGTAGSFDYLDKLYDGFVQVSPGAR